jgi:hypothetical protein
MEMRLEPLDRSLALVIQASGNCRVADLKLHRQVNVARESGHSWAAIGYALGISKRAAQQRFGRATENETE